MSRTIDIFTKLEIDIMKVLSGNPDTYMSQYEIYNKLCENLVISDPIEKENLKFRFLIVLRQLSSIFSGVVVLNKNGKLTAGFFIDDTSKNNEQEYISGQKEEELEDESSNLPNELSVVRFIVDENIKEFFSRVDYQGNTLLHTLVIHSDSERIQKVIDTDTCSFSDRNNKGETPLDLINDFKVNNIITRYIFERFSDLEYEVMMLKSTNTQIESNLKFYLYYLVPVLAFVYLKLLFRF